MITDDIKTILLPAAGLGSRLFPTTFAIPKELFPLRNKPVIHYVLEEALRANINSAVVISSPRKEHLHRYLSYDEDMCTIDLNKEERKRLSSLCQLNKQFSYSFLIQEKALGVSNAILLAKDVLRKDSFFCMAYPDDLIHDLDQGIKMIKAISKKYNASVILLEEVELERVSLYGVVSFEEMEDNLLKIKSVVEKPSIEEAPSRFAIVGRYILSCNIFNYLDRQNSDNPFIIAAFNEMIADGHLFIGVVLKTKRYDIGNYQGWIEAVNNL